MPASTIRLDDALLRKIRAAKPTEQSLAAYVREAIERDLLRRKLRAAAEAYRTFLDEHPEEQDQEHAWERAPLASAPRRTRK